MPPLAMLRPVETDIVRIGFCSYMNILADSEEIVGPLLFLELVNDSVSTAKIGNV
jgi:hypothetical protein